ncbi:MAG: hypothetical protein A4E19_07180 [Nitrospira sp. SG-bin1]|nr:MAG: hypothetical protein A4E19_07180 [Nitrospira sp. SG-bin1]
MILLSGVALLLSLIACQHRSFPTMTIFDDPSRFVRLEVNRTVGGGHAHPADITTDEMIAVLSGVMIEEPPGFLRSLSLSTKGDEPRQHPAFNEAEISFFAPFLAEGLKTAKSDQIVTFGQTSQKAAFLEIASGGMLVTSGGLFINGDELHLILGNYRSPANYAPDPGIGATLDGRSAPLQPIAPQRTTLYFEPTTAVAPSRKSFLSRLLGPDRHEIVVLFKQLAAGTVKSVK